MSEVAVVAIITAAALVGLTINVRAVRRGADDIERSRVEGFTVSDLALPLLTLVALLLAFVLVATFSSFEEASESASLEANAVVIEGESASLLDGETATSLIGALQCYARAVAGPGWRALEATRETSPVSQQASDRVRDVLQQAVAADSDPEILSRVLDAEDVRVEARNRRLAEAQPSVPTAVTVLLVVSVAILVFGAAAMAHRRMRLRLTILVVAATVVIFAGTLGVIVDLDRPFGGLASIEPTEMREAARQLGELIAPAQPPCDADGAVAAS